MKESNQQNSRGRFCTPEEAAHVLGSGGIVAFPTETHYGLGVDPFNHDAVDRLFRLKERDRGKPILLLVRDRTSLERVVASTPSVYIRLMDRYWPGPLTLVFPAKRSVLSTVTGGSGKIGVRISSSETVVKMLDYWHMPVTATSANKSGGYPAQSAADIVDIFGDQIDCIVDGGIAPGGRSSTVVEYLRGRLHVLRRGKIELSPEELNPL